MYITDVQTHLGCFVCQCINFNRMMLLWKLYVVPKQTHNLHVYILFDTGPMTKTSSHSIDFQYCIYIYLYDIRPLVCKHCHYADISYRRLQATPVKITGNPTK